MKLILVILMYQIVNSQSKSVKFDEKKSSKLTDSDSKGNDYIEYEYYYDINSPKLEYFLINIENQNDATNGNDINVNLENEEETDVNIEIKENEFDFDDCYETFSESAFEIHNKLRKREGIRPLKLLKKDNNLSTVDANGFLVEQFESLNDTISTNENQNLYKEIFDEISDDICETIAFRSIQSWFNQTDMIDFTHANLKSVHFGLTVTGKDINENRWLIAVAEYN